MQRRFSPTSIQLAYGAYFILALAVCIKTAIAPEKHTVFPKFAAGAAHWWLGEPVYSHYEHLGQFRYSPTFAISMTPFALLGTVGGSIVWSLLGIMLYLHGLRSLVKAVLPGAWPPNREALLLCLAMIGAIRGIWNAQSNIYVVACLMLAVSAIARERWWLAAVMIVVPTFLKVSPIAVGLLIVAIHPARLAWRCGVALIIGALIPFLTQELAFVLAQYNAWFVHLSETANARWPSFRDAWSIWEQIHSPINVTAYHCLQVITAVAALIWCIRQKQRAPSTRCLWTTTLAMGAAWLMVFGPAVEYNTYVILAPMMVWALLISFEVAYGRFIITLAFAMTTLLSAGAVERVLLRFGDVFVCMLPIGSLLFIIWLLAYSNRVCEMAIRERGP